MTDSNRAGEKYNVQVERLDGEWSCYGDECTDEARYDVSYQRRGEPYTFYQSFCDRCLPTTYRFKITEDLE